MVEQSVVNIVENNNIIINEVKRIIHNIVKEQGIVNIIMKYDPRMFVKYKSINVDSRLLSAKTLKMIRGDGCKYIFKDDIPSFKECEQLGTVLTYIAYSPQVASPDVINRFELYDVFVNAINKIKYNDNILDLLNQPHNIHKIFTEIQNKESYSCFDIRSNPHSTLLSSICSIKKKSHYKFIDDLLIDILSREKECVLKYFTKQNAYVNEKCSMFENHKAMIWIKNILKNVLLNIKKSDTYINVSYPHAHESDTFVSRCVKIYRSTPLQHLVKNGRYKVIEKIVSLTGNKNIIKYFEQHIVDLQNKGQYGLVVKILTNHHTIY